MYAIKTLFAELCGLLKAAEINLKGLFSNADPGFDSADFIAACEAEDIFANVKSNPRNSAQCD